MNMKILTYCTVNSLFASLSNTTTPLKPTGQQCRASTHFTIMHDRIRRDGPLPTTRSGLAGKGTPRTLTQNMISYSKYSI